MFFSRITLKPEVGRIQLLKQMGRNQYQLHQLLWNLFEGKSTRKNGKGKELADFHYRADYPDKRLLVYLVSDREPKNRDGIWDIQSRLYEPVIEKGQTWQFYLRVNPTISLYGRTKNKRHDGLMHAKRLLQQSFEEQNRTPDRYEIWAAQQSAAKDWLIKRESKIGAYIDPANLIIDNYRQEIVVTNSSDDGIRFSSVDLTGLFTITEPEKLKEILFRGLGKSKAFGCGLMLVKRIAE